MGVLQNPLERNGNIAQPHKRSVYELLGTNILGLPDDKCLPIETQTNVIGTQFTTYLKQLPQKEYGIFDRLEITYFSPEDYNVHFQTREVTGEIIPHLRHLVNELHAIYGDDDIDNESWEHTEEEAILLHRNWTGRMWCNAETISDKPHLVIHYKGEGHPLEMAVYGVPRFRPATSG